MGCTSSKPAPRSKPRSYPQQMNDPYRPPRKSTRPLHPSAHPPDSLPFQPRTYAYSSAPVKRKNGQPMKPHAPPPVAFTTQCQRGTAQASTQSAGKDGAWWKNEKQQSHGKRMSRSKGGSKGWILVDGNPTSTATSGGRGKAQRMQENPKHNQTRTVDKRLQYRYPPCPDPPPGKPIHKIPRKPVPERSSAVLASSSQAKGNVKKGKPYTIVWQASDQSRFPVAPGPPPNRPIPLLPIAKPQQGIASSGGRVQQQAPASNYTASAYLPFPSRPGLPPDRLLPPRPLVSPIARNYRGKASISVYSSVSSLGPEPERLLPHIPRAGKASRTQWARLGDIGKSGGRY